MTNINSKMSTKDINKALKKGGNFIFETGVYKLTEPLVISANSTKVMCKDDVVFERHHKGRMLYSFCKPTTTKYNGISNFEWSGGLFKADTNKSNASVIVLFHVNGFKLSDVTIYGCIGLHSIELNACCDGSIEDCSISGQSSRGNETFREAIQLDFANLDGLSWDGADNKSKCYDGTHCKNIVIKKNTISNCPVGIGTHTVSNDSKWHTNVSIESNDIANCDIDIRLCGFKDTNVFDQKNVKCVTLSTAHKYKGGKIKLDKPRGNKNCKIYQCEMVVLTEN